MSCTHALGGRMFTNHDQIRVGVCADCNAPLLGRASLPEPYSGREAVVQWSRCSLRGALREACKPGDAGEPRRLACLQVSRDDLDANPPLVASPQHRSAYWMTHRILDEEIAALQRRARRGSPIARLRVLAALLSHRH